ncbi:MAG: DNA replication complex GINS family protein [Desulfurococcales archaeon]|nr:DNA replication complex GINS family protein [Desulfurococcales archaeon]
MDINSRLRLVRLDYMARGVRVLFLRDHPDLPTPGGVVNARRGDEMTLPRWQAKMLEAQGVVDIRDTTVDIDIINMYHFRERKSSAANKLSQLPQDFYMKAGELVERLDRLIREAPSSMLIRDREVLEKNLAELSEARLLKILRLAQTGGGEELRDRMTPEEQIIYDNVKRVVDSWRGYIRSLFPGV